MIKNLMRCMGMWNFTVYVLREYAKRTGKEEMKFIELYEFAFNKLLREKRLTFWDGKSDLQRDVEYLEKYEEVVSIHRAERVDDWTIRLLNKEKLEKKARSLEAFAKEKKIGLMMEYIEKIKEAANEKWGSYKRN